MNSLVSKVKLLIANSWPYKNRNMILFGVIIILLLLIKFRKPHESMTISSSNQDLMRKVEIKRDANDQTFAKLQQVVISRDEALKRADSLAKALKIKPKFIKGEDVTITRVDTIFSVPSHPFATSSGDTAYKVEKHDAYVDIEAIAGKSTGSIGYKSRDTVTRTEIYRTPLIGRNERYVTIRSANPYNTIVEGYSWKVQEKTPWLTIGPSVQFNPFTKKVDFGISIQVPIIKLNK